MSEVKLFLIKNIPFRMGITIHILKSVKKQKNSQKIFRMFVKRKFTIGSRIIFRLYLSFLTFSWKVQRPIRYKELRSPWSLQGNPTQSDIYGSYSWETAWRNWKTQLVSQHNFKNLLRTFFWYTYLEMSISA